MKNFFPSFENKRNEISMYLDRSHRSHSQEYFPTKGNELEQVGNKITSGRYVETEVRNPPQTDHGKLTITRFRGSVSLTDALVAR